VEADPAHVQPLRNFFSTKFRWHPGEYICRLTINTEPERAKYVHDLRIRIFESDTKELEDYCDRYSYGFGVWLEDAQHVTVGIPLADA
jgi:hypothetical protein